MSLSLYEEILKRAHEDGGVNPTPDSFHSDASRNLAKYGLLEARSDGQFNATEFGRRAWETCRDDDSPR